jgi:hypothetical protein
MMESGPSQSSAQPHQRRCAIMIEGHALFSPTKGLISDVLLRAGPIFVSCGSAASSSWLSCCPDMELRLPLFTTTEHACVDPYLVKIGKEFQG